MPWNAIAFRFWCRCSWRRPSDAAGIRRTSRNWHSIPAAPTRRLHSSSKRKPHSTPTTRNARSRSRTRGSPRDPDKRAFLIVRGEAYELDGRLADSLADCQRVLKSDPANARALFERALIYRDYDRLEDAVADLRAALVAEPKRAETHAALAMCLDCDKSEVDAEFDEAIRLDPQNARIYQNRLILWINRNEIDKARADLAKLKGLNERSSSFEICEGLVALVTNDFEKAREKFEQLTRHPKASRRQLGHAALVNYHKIVTKDGRSQLAELSEAMKLRPCAAFLLERAGLRYADKDYSEALADVAAYLQLNPRGSRAALAIRADSLALSGRQLEALADYDRILKLDPDDCQARRDRSNAHATLFHYRDCLADWDECVRRRPNSADIRRVRAYHRMQLGQLDSALEDLTVALKQQPSTAETTGAIHEARSYCFAAANRFDEAIAEAAGSDSAAAGRIGVPVPARVRLLPRRQDRQGERSSRRISAGAIRTTFVGLIGRAACLSKLGKTAEAAAEVARIRESTGTVLFEMVLRDFASTDTVAGLGREAFARHGMVDALVEHDPENLLLRLYLARGLMLAGQSALAIAECERVLGKDPESWLAVSLRARLRCETEPMRAIADCDRGMAMNPTHVGFPLATRPRTPQARRIREGDPRLRRGDPAPAQHRPKLRASGPDLARARRIGEGEGRLGDGEPSRDPAVPRSARSGDRERLRRRNVQRREPEHLPHREMPPGGNAFRGDPALVRASEARLPDVQRFASPRCRLAVRGRKGDGRTHGNGRCGSSGPEGRVGPCRKRVHAPGTSTLPTSRRRPVREPPPGAEIGHHVDSSRIRSPGHRRDRSGDRRCGRVAGGEPEGAGGRSRHRPSVSGIVPSPTRRNEGGARRSRKSGRSRAERLLSSDGRLPTDTTDAAIRSKRSNCWRTCRAKLRLDTRPRRPPREPPAWESSVEGRRPPTHWRSRRRRRVWRTRPSPISTWRSGLIAGMPWLSPTGPACCSNGERPKKRSPIATGLWSSIRCAGKRSASVRKPWPSVSRTGPSPIAIEGSE